MSTVNANFKSISTLIRWKPNLQKRKTRVKWICIISAVYLCVHSTFHALRELLTEQMSSLVKSKGMLLTGQESSDSTVVSRKKMLLYPSTTKIFLKNKNQKNKTINCFIVFRKYIISLHNVKFFIGCLRNTVTWWAYLKWRTKIIFLVCS